MSGPPPACIHTERLLLRVPEARDVQAIVAYYRANKAHLRPWSPSWPEGFLTESFWQEQARAVQAEHTEGSASRFYLSERRRPDQVIGSLALTQIVRGGAQSAVLGYGLAAGSQGAGFMVESVQAGVAFAFATLRLHRVMANYMPANQRSAAVLRRCGFNVEGYARDYLLINGRWEDHVLTALSNPNWS